MTTGPAIAKALCGKPTLSETNRRLDLSSIGDLDIFYAKNVDAWFNQWRLDDLKCRIMIRPKAVNHGQAKAMGIYFWTASEIEHDCRKVQFTLETNGDTMTFIQPVHKCTPGGWGWPNAILFSTVKTHPIININVKLNHDPSFVQKVSAQTFEKRLEKMHELSSSHGDIILIVKLDQNVSNNMCAPPLKKRKLNTNSHQSEGSLNETDAIQLKFSSIILRASSKVFDAMLSANMMETQQKRIEIQAKTVCDVKNLLHFMSTNKLKKDSNAVNVMRLAHYYEMDGLFWKCVNKAIKDVSIHNFANTINTFDTLQISKGYKGLVQFAKENKEKLKKTEDFDTIPHSFRCTVLNIED